MARLVGIIAASCFAALPLAALTAQGTTEGTVNGIVLTARSTPVAGATVTLDSSLARTLSDSAGRFAFRNVAVGRHTLEARRLGFAMATAEATVRAGESTTVALRLAPAAQVLPEVEVRGRRVIDLPRFTAAVERASRNNGAVFTADDIAKENPLDTKSLLERLPGVHVNDRGISFARCQDSGMLPNPNTSGGGRGGAAAFMTPHGPSARVQVYVDGKRLTHDVDASSNPQYDIDDANGIRKSINPRSIAVMEVYTGIARIPGEYLEDACAVIAIWTKAY